MFLKASAIAAGCPVTLMSFDDAGAVLASPSLLKQSSLVIEIAGGCGPGWHRGPGAIAGAIGVPGADVAGSGQRLGAPPCLPLVIAAKMEKPRAEGFSLSGHSGSGDSLARHRVAIPLCFPAEGQRIF